MLRDYQQRAINQLYDWLREHDGHPCLVLPTGSGKSHIVAAICKDAVQSWPETRILMLTHVKELIEQNAAKMREHWRNAPLGIYSASIGRREIDRITFAGIQSVRDKASRIGRVDLIIIDECHLVSHRDQGSYRRLIADLSAINPGLRVVGLTATPYRLGHGLITDEPALFDALIEPVTIPELIDGGYLAPLRSKLTQTRLEASGVGKRGGEYVEAQLQAAVDTADQNRRVVDEIIRLAGVRSSWLVFCAGVDHAQHVADILQQRGIPAACVTGKTPKAERAYWLSEFRAGRIRALTNANVLTTGFDHPDTDLIAMLRPTLSPGLYVQMAGRGLRPKSHTDHCLVLDFAGNVALHGPITAVVPPSRAGNGEAPTRTCPDCAEIVHTATRTCPACGYQWPEPERQENPLHLHNHDIMGLGAQEMPVQEWVWRERVSRTSGKPMLTVTYYGGLSDPAVTEYLTVAHGGDAGQRAMIRLAALAQQARTDIRDCEGLQAVCERMNAAPPPVEVHYKREGKFFRVINRIFSC